MGSETNRAAEIRKRLEAVNGYKIVSKEVRTVREPLTPEQMEVVAKDMADHIMEATRLEEEKKQVTKDLKDRMDEQYAIANTLAETYEKGYEDNECDVFVVADFQAKIRRVFSIKTGLQVSQEVLRDRDLQEELKLKPEAPKPTSKEEPGEPEAKMTGEGDVIIMANPERIALGFEGDTASSGTSTEEGAQILEADYEVLDNQKKEEAKPVNELAMVTQIRRVEKKDGVTFITTAENAVFFTDNKAFADAAETNMKRNKAGAERGKSFYVEIKYLDTDSRNQQVTDITEREVPQNSQDDTDLVPIDSSNHLIEEGDDPDEAPSIPAHEPEESDDTDDEQF